MRGRNHQLKVIIGCVITGAFSWLMNAFSKENYTLRFNYPVSFVYDDSLYVPVQPLPATVSANVSGDGWSLLRKSLETFKREPVQYVVTNPLKARSISTSILREEILERFPGLTVNYVVSDTIELEFERRVQKVIPLRVDSSSIDLAPGYWLSSYINMTPSLIAVDGPQSLIRQYPDSVSIRIPRKRIRENYEAVLQIPLKESPMVKLSHDEVYVSFEVTEL